MAKTNDFSKAVKIRLIELEKNQNWLIEQVREKTGLYCDTGYMWKVLNDVRNAPKIVAAIREILRLDDLEGSDEGC